MTAELDRLRGSTSLSDLLRRLAARHDERVAVVGEHSQLSFAQLDLAASELAAALAAAGYGAGSHIGLLAGNGPQWLTIAFAVWRCGATLVPISTFVTALELKDIVTHADVSLLFAQPRLRSHSFDDALSEVCKLTHPPHVIRLEPGSVPPPRLVPRTHPLLESTRARSIACILYTSGTTGRAKGVMLSHAAILSTTLATAPRTGLSTSDTLLSTLPLFWVAGLVIRALPTLASGCTLVLPETFTVDVAVALMRRYRTTALHLRPPQVGQILSHRDFTPALLAEVTRGGGRRAWYSPHLNNARLITGYGMTEMAGYVTALDSRDPLDILDSGIGTPLPDVTLRIVNSEGLPCPAGTSGEIQVRGPGMFSGYYKEPAHTGLDADGWFLTGDLGWIDESGAFHFSGRSKDLLRVKGINVSPVEVEVVLAAHAAVEAAYVVGLPPDGLDQRVVALVVCKSAVSSSDLAAHVATQLSHYKRPTDYVFIERSDVPLGGTSKPQRAELAAIASRRGAARQS